MPAYIIADVQVTDPEVYVGYTKLVPATVEAYGGKFVVRGEPPKILRATGNPTGWSCSNSRVLPRPGRGITRKSTVSPRASGTALLMGK